MKHQIKFIVPCFLIIKNNSKNTSHEELLLDTSIIFNEIDNMNAETENRNLTMKTGNSNRHKKNRKRNSEQQEYKNPKQLTEKNENQLAYEMTVW